MITSWKKVKKSGNYYKKLSKERALMLQRAREVDVVLKKKAETVQRFGLSSNTTENVTSGDLDVSREPRTSSNDISGCICIHSSKESGTGEKNCIDASKNQENVVSFAVDESSEDDDDVEKNQNFRSDLRKWAMQYSINHSALKNLLKIVNTRFERGTKILPEDPRTFLQTPQTVNIMALSDGEYWHHGIKNCLVELFMDLAEALIISVNINMDGLPLFKSSKIEFWPILFNIAEYPEVPAMVIGIYCGKSKCHDLESFLLPFVVEMDEIMTNGVYINSHKITVLIRCFICDSPARAFVKGVANFNAQHGCLKCTTLGEYSHISHTNIFPRTTCEKRTDEKFRMNSYGSHHKSLSPLLKLNIDMIEQFPVGDALHLLHLGIMKRLLFGWRDGTFRNSETKWRAEITNEVSEYLNRCKMPAEFHRVVRGLDCLTHWKGTEYRTFLHYVGIVALKDILTPDLYNHFMLLFCSVTICSSKQYFSMLPLANAMLLQYIEIFAETYGEQYITSNVHNLVHLVDEVMRFGALDSFSAYPFENILGKIKRMLRNGNRPLAQVAKRIIEDSNCTTFSKYEDTEKPNQGHQPTLSQPNAGENLPECLRMGLNSAVFYFKVKLRHFSLSTDSKNCWFLTKENEIACVINIMVSNKDGIQLCCVEWKEKTNFFKLPIESRHLNIFHVLHKNQLKSRSTKLIKLCEINCKLVRLTYHSNFVFIPLLHTNQ